MFYVDDADIDREHIKVSSSNRLCSNHSSIIQNSAARMSSQLQQQQQQQQSNNYSLPQNNSSGSEMNYICDQKSTSSASVSSSLGGGGTDTSNGYEFNRSTVQRNSVVQPFDNHHSHHFMTAAIDVNKSVVFPTQAPVQHTPQQLNYIDQQLQNQHKNNIPQHQQKQQQQQPKTLTIIANQRHLQRQVAGSNESSGSSIVGGGDVHANNLNNIDATCLPSTNLNVTNCSNTSSSCNNSTNMTSISYNHNHSNNSSKTSSVSSESSSSTIGDNEEDWESGESQAKQLDHITLLLSTSSITNPTSALPLPSINPTPPTKYLNKDNTTQSLRTCKTSKSDVQDSSNTSSSTSTSTSNSSNHPSNNKSKTINSSCTFRVVGGDDDDDDDNDNDNIDDDRKLKHKKLNLNNVVKLAPTITDTNTKSVESKGGDNNIISSVQCEAGQTPIIPAQTSRPKLMHLLMAPKYLQHSAHKPIFKRKSYKLVKGSNSNSGGSSMSTDGSNNLLASSAAIAATGGVGTSSKQKLKIKLKKNKLKLSQKFHWFQSYFRADPVDFCENFVQQTTSMRRNSLCSMASRTHKLSTTTPPSVTPPPQTNAESSCERLDRAASAQSMSTSDASIATGDLCEDYYSSICDNQLSFSNSPCKSPRSMAGMGSSISGVGGGMTHGSSFGSSFAKSSGSSNPYLRERRETLPGCSSHVNSRRNNVVVVAAKPAKIHAIGFNVNAINLARQDSFETNGEDDVDASPDSIYYTPSSALLPSTGNANDHTAFVFPQIRQESDLEALKAEHDEYIKTTNNSASISKPQAKYSLNLVIVKECSEASSEKTTNPTIISESVSTESNNESDGTESDGCDCSHKGEGGDNRLQNLTMLLEESESEKIRKSKTSASVCSNSNSSSSGFCTSECCTTNSSSSICNCNPFALDLERHVASTKQGSQHNAIQEIVEATYIDNNLCDTEEKANDLGTEEVTTNTNDTELDANSTCDRQ